VPYCPFCINGPAAAQSPLYWTTNIRALSNTNDCARRTQQCRMNWRVHNNHNYARTRWHPTGASNHAKVECLETRPESMTHPTRVTPSFETTKSENEL
jgi:hypothetical protein